MARVAASAFGFLIFSHAFDGPDLYGALSFFAKLAYGFEHFYAFGVLDVLNAATGTLKHFAQDSFALGNGFLRTSSPFGWVSLMIGLAPILDPIRTSRQWLANRTLKRTLDRIRCNGQDPDKPHLLTAHGTVGPADKQRY